VDEKVTRKVETYLRGAFANARIRLVPRPKQKDSCEVYVGEEFGRGRGRLVHVRDGDPGGRSALGAWSRRDIIK
jgi:hypothetical protein